VLRVLYSALSKPASVVIFWNVEPTMHLNSCLPCRRVCYAKYSGVLRSWIRDAM